jgi:NADH-quinone oxidoreductase subunit K
MFDNFYENNPHNDFMTNYVVGVLRLQEVNTVNDALPFLVLFASLLFLAGLFGILYSYSNFLITMMAIELMYLGAVSSFVLYGALCYDTRGFIYALLLLILAACESALGLGMIIVLYRFDRTIDFDAFQELGG